MRRCKFADVIIIALIGAFALSSGTFAQERQINEREIKLSGKYYWGEGIRKEVNKAKADAVSDLQYKISVTVRSSSSSNVTENNDEFSSSFSKNVQMSSSIRLKGLEFLITTLSSGKSKVVAYLSKENYRTMMKQISDDIIEKTNIAEAEEDSLGIIPAVSDYYTAYLMTFSHPDPIPYHSKTYKQDYKNIRFFLETKVKTYLAEIEISQDSLWMDPSGAEMIFVSLNVTYLKSKADNVELSFNIPGNPKQRVQKGKAKLFLYSLPSAVNEEDELNLNIIFNGDKDLQHYNDQFGIIVKKKIMLNFSGIVKVDYKVTKLEDGSLMFEPIIKNISVSVLNWNTDNGMTSTDSKFICRFNNGKNHKVTLQINNSKLMTVSKFIDNDGKIKEVLEVKKKEKSKLSPVVAELLKYKTYDTLIGQIVKMKDEGKLVFSMKKDDFINLNNCYGIAIDVHTREIVGFFTPGIKERLDLITNKKFNSYVKKFKGKGILWFQLY